MVTLVYQEYEFNKKRYKKEETTIKKHLDEAVIIDHVGSTAIPNIYGKNILDILVGVPNKNIFNETKKQLLNLGYKIKDNAKDFKDEIQPRYVFRLDIKGKTEEEIMAGFHQKWRYNIRLAAKKGVEVREGTREDLKAFHKIMVETGSRDGFIIRPLEYFEKMYDNLAPEHMKLLMAYYDNEPISGVIPIFYGNKTWYLYGASSNKHRNLMPNYLLQWEMIKMAIARHDDIYDFRGVSGVVDETHPQYGLYRFKKGFGGKFTEFLGEIYIPYKPITYKLYRFSEKLFRTLRQIKRKI